MRVHNVTKVFDTVRALNRVSFEISAGDVAAVMGPNGAGKSTLTHVLSLRTRPTRGDVMVNGVAADAGDPFVAARIGLLSHHPLVYPDLTCRENLLFFASLCGIEHPREVVAGLEQQLDLAAFAGDRATQVLSRGQLQRVALARSLLSNPDLLLLDEPAAGLDHDAVTRIKGVLDALVARNGMAVVVTHNPEFAAQVASRALMMRRGQIVADVPTPGSASDWTSLYRAAIGREGAQCGS
ncbi:MAG: ABC transporter ATP-binding protein [Myxococcota bacterium]|nr:ABC transporter ATP-binding protein [Myxococcota bacterium]